MRSRLKTLLICCFPLLLVDASLAKDVELLCKGILTESSRDTRRPGSDYFDRSREVQTKVDLRETGAVGSPEMQNLTADVFPGGLRKGLVFLGGQQTAGLFVSPFERCNITDHQVTCGKRTESGPGDRFTQKFDSYPEEDLSELNAQIRAQLTFSLPKELVRVTTETLELDRRSGVLEIQGTQETRLPIKAGDQVPFTVWTMRRATLTCERFPDKPKF